jgi:hypothetical protein
MRLQNAFTLLFIFQFSILAFAMFFYIFMVLNNTIFKNTLLFNVYQKNVTWLSSALPLIFVIVLFISLIDSYLNPSYAKAFIYFVFMLSFGFIYALTQNIIINFFNATQQIFLNSTMKETFQDSYQFVFNKNYAFLTFVLLGFNVLVNIYALKSSESYG